MLYANSFSFFYRVLWVDLHLRPPEFPWAIKEQPLSNKKNPPVLSPFLFPPPSSLFLSTDTFASKVAAIQDQYADASIGNVTGSNAVNVFLGIGVAWTIAAVYWQSQGKQFKVPPGSLAFSVTLFTILALLCVVILLYRRRASVSGGELGGPRTAKLLTVFLFFTLWLIYILLSSLETYCQVPGF